jgi:hypothetical protein
MKNITNVNSLQAPTNDYHCNTASKLSETFEKILNERIALSKDVIHSMNSINRWNCSSAIRSSAMRLAGEVKVYLDKRVDIDALVQKYGISNAVEIAETKLEQLHSIRSEYRSEWSRLISLAMRQKVMSIKIVRTVMTVVRRVMNHFRSPRTHRNRRLRLAVASAGGGDPGGSDGPDAEPPKRRSLTVSSLAAGWSR